MPQAILLQDVENVGERGNVVDVSKGYLRNFLIPRKLAEPATKGAIAAAQKRAASRGLSRGLRMAASSSGVAASRGKREANTASKPKSRNCSAK